jgi:hypothetical protein
VRDLPGMGHRVGPLFPILLPSNIFLLSTYCVPATFVGAGNTMVDRQTRSFTLNGGDKKVHKESTSGCLEEKGDRWRC